MVRGNSELKPNLHTPAVIVFSGPICAGKSSVAQAAARSLNAELISVRAILMDRLGTEKPTRQRLQELGSELERETSGKWLLSFDLDMRSCDVLIFDAVRTSAQIEALRSAFADVFHCHITASSSSRQLRFQATRCELAEDLSFDRVSVDPIESGVSQLAEMADLNLDSTDASTAELAQSLVHSWTSRQ